MIYDTPQEMKLWIGIPLKYVTSTGAYTTEVFTQKVPYYKHDIELSLTKKLWVVNKEEAILLNNIGIV